MGGVEGGIGCGVGGGETLLRGEEMKGEVLTTAE